MDTISKIYYDVEKEIKNGEYLLEIIKKEIFSKRFPPKPIDFDDVTNINWEIDKVQTLEERFEFNDGRLDKIDQLDEYICNFLLYKWLLDHNDNRSQDFTFILIPKNIETDLTNLSFDDLAHFISPQTQYV